MTIRDRIRFWLYAPQLEAHIAELEKTVLELKTKVAVQERALMANGIFTGLIPLTNWSCTDMKIPKGY